MTILTITGHREIDDFAKFRHNLTVVLTDPDVTALIQGCASGVDLQAGKIAIDLRVPVISAMPWTTHKPRKEDHELYSWILRHSEECYPVTESETFPGNWCYHARNKWMVDEGDEVIAWWNGQEGGGTYECLKYAHKVNKPIKNLYRMEP